ncbi:MAG TPA: SH3 domain-containing protein [Devosiaceae bacterium]
MNSLKLAVGAALAAIGLMAATSAALAVEAEATAAVNVRSGPGTSYGVVDTLYNGERVDVTECTPSGTWCYLTHDGPDGWVSASYLRNVAGEPAPSSEGGSPTVNFGIQIPLGGGGSVYLGTGNPPPPAPAPSVTPRVCFYNLNNYGGASFCRNAPKSATNLTGIWNDRISSLRVFGGARVKVCRDFGLGGYCRTVDYNVPSFGIPLNNRISSYRIYLY